MAAVGTATTAATTPQVHKCALPGCDKTDAVAALLICAGCEVKLPTYYCSQEHYKTDWARHEPECLQNRVAIVVDPLTQMCGPPIPEYGMQFISVIIALLNAGHISGSTSFVSEKK